MADQHDPLLITLGRELIQKLIHALSDLLVTFSIWKWDVRRDRTRCFDVCSWTSCEVTIITFAKPSILDNRNSRALEDETGGFICPLGVRRKNDIKGFACVLAAEDRPCARSPGIGQRNIIMARGKTFNVMNGLCVSLNPNLNHGVTKCLTVSEQSARTDDLGQADDG